MSAINPHLRTMTPLEEQRLKERHNAFVQKYMLKRSEETSARIREAAKNGTLRQLPPTPRPDSKRSQSSAPDQPAASDS